MEQQQHRELVQCTECHGPFLIVMNMEKVNGLWKHKDCKRQEMKDDDNLSEMKEKAMSYKLVNNSRMMASQSGRFARLRKERNESIAIVCDTLSSLSDNAAATITEGELKTQ